MIAKNNPLNIRYNENTNWLGQIGRNKGFVEFDSMEHGFRAALWLIKRTYMHRYGLNTIREVISRFAPNNENDTYGYIQIISNAMDMSASSFLCDYDVPFLVSHMAKVETDTFVYPHELTSIINKYKI
ncbi:MAG: hypothetical protein J6S67_01875 [Methanobrevibacter sp.]|nr:hypothetical protein [Methanobrevibacter sp.]